MIGRKITILGAAVATLASSAIGATALQSPNAKAADVADDAVELVQEAQHELDNLEPTTIDLREASAPGNGESLILVIAGQVPVAEGTQKLAEVNSRFGEIDGFSIDSTDNYEVTGAFVQTSQDTVAVPCGPDDCPEGMTTANELQPVQLEYVTGDAISAIESVQGLLTTDLNFAPEQSLILTGFRTKRGAEEFIELSRALGLTGLVTIQARKIGGGEIGLGQEPHPDGSGPLLESLSNQKDYQR